MDTKRLHRKCPHCGGKTGFEVDIMLKGSHVKKMTFKGRIIEEERIGTDDIDSTRCLDCKKLIDAERLDMKNV